MDPIILADLKAAFGIVPETITSVSGGWLNDKWRVTHANGDVLVKRLSLTRYSEKGIREIEAALQRQNALEGIPCPRLYQAGESILRRPDKDTVYFVMDFCPGYTVTPDSVALKQLRDLGQVLGRIHRQLDKRTDAESVRGYPFSGKSILDDLKKAYAKRSDALTEDDPEEYREALKRWEKILQGLTEEYLDSLPRGIGHEDFTPDNMLFCDDGVAAILDFDRNQYGFRYHDVGRALLSFALMEDELDPERTEAFLTGYATEYPFDRSFLPDVFRATWCVESIWWINRETFASTNPKLMRFLKETLWVMGEI